MNPIKQAIRDRAAVMVETVTSFRTPDGELHSSANGATIHQASILTAEDANAILEQGGSVGQALEETGHHVSDPILYQLTTQSKLSIPHWQCQDQAGYQPSYFRSGMMLYVGGDAGSWSGPYGSWVDLSELVRYAKDERSILTPALSAT